MDTIHIVQQPTYHMHLRKQMKTLHGHYDIYIYDIQCGKPNN